MAACLKCKKRDANEKLYLLLYDKKTKENLSDEKQRKADPLIIGSLRIAVCPYCLAKMAWRSVGKSLLSFIAETTAVFLLAWLLSKLFQVAWIGGGLVWLGLCANFFKKIGSAVKTADRLGAGRFAYDDYLKHGVIPRRDFSWLNEGSLETFSEFGFSLEKSDSFDPDDLMMVDEQTAADIMAKTPDMTEAEKSTITNAFAATKQMAPQSPEIKLPTVLKCFWQPVAASLNLAVALLTAFLFVEETSFVEETYNGAILPLILAIVSGISGIGGAILLMRQKKQGYIFTALMLGLLWFFAIGSGSRILRGDSVGLTVMVLIPALLYIPFIKGYPPAKHGPVSQTEGAGYGRDR
ncbi:MAG: hypothetical protein ABFC62_11475 [Clostridiaceae bacterium]